MPTYTAVDNADGTGITVTIAGGTGGETHTVYYQNINGEIDTWTFTSGGSRVGDGTVVVAVSGFHWWYVSSSVSGVSVVKAGYASTADSSTHYQCVESAHARILLLTLPGLSNDDIQIRKLPIDREWEDGTFNYPGIIVSSMGAESQSPQQGTNVRDDIEYPVFVSILAAENQDLVANHDRYLIWRQRINKAFRQQKLPGVSCVVQCKVQPFPIKSTNAFFNNVHHSSLLIRCVSRETRGI